MLDIIPSARCLDLKKKKLIRIVLTYNLIRENSYNRIRGNSYNLIEENSYYLIREIHITYLGKIHTTELGKIHITFVIILVMLFIFFSSIFYMVIFLPKASRGSGPFDLKLNALPSDHRTY